MKYKILVVLALCVLALGCSNEGSENGQTTQQETTEPVVETLQAQISGGYQGDVPFNLLANVAGKTPQQIQAAYNRVGLDAQALARELNLDAELIQIGLDYYNIQDGTWTRKPAVIQATITDGEVTLLQVEAPGAGYNAIPTITVPGHNVDVEIEMVYNDNLLTNGGITSVTLK